MSASKSFFDDKREYTLSVENIALNLLTNMPTNELLSTPSISNHTHTYNELFVCHSGELYIETKEETILLNKGDAAIIPANLSHHKIDNDYEDWDSVGFSVVKKSGACRNDLYNRLKLLCEDDKIALFKNVPEICKKVAELHEILPEAIGYLPAVEFVSVLSHLAILKPETSRNVSVSQIHTHDVYRMAWLEDLIHGRFNQPLTISKVAAMLNISSRQLSRIVKEQYGKTFHQVLTEERLNIAAKLLCTTDYSVSKILKDVGYTKNSLFYRDFGAQFSMTPTEYRKKNAKNQV